MSDGFNAGNIPVANDVNDVHTSTDANQGVTESEKSPMTPNQMLAEMSKLQKQVLDLAAENKKLRTNTNRSVYIAVSEKGGVSVYGLWRFPVTLYKAGWLKLLDMADEIRTFIEAHDDDLAQPGDEPRPGRKPGDSNHPQVSHNRGNGVKA